MNLRTAYIATGVGVAAFLGIYAARTGAIDAPMPELHEGKTSTADDLVAWGAAHVLMGVMAYYAGGYLTGAKR